MSLAGGSLFGPYEIISLIGKGGMGEVFRAHDTQLCCPVAGIGLSERMPLAAWQPRTRSMPIFGA